MFEDTPWLKFSLASKTVYLPKKPIAKEVSWEHIYQAGAVYGSPGLSGMNPSGNPTEQNSQVTIGPHTYMVRLLTGGDADPASAAGGEWNRLMYPVHVDDPDGLGWGIDYTDADLRLVDTGRATWTQEADGANADNRIYRGNGGVTSFGSSIPTIENSPYGWRPVLELIE